MGVCARRFLVPLLVLLGGWFAAPALAAGSAGVDPSSNYPIGAMPGACQTDPTGSVCIDAAVTYLDQARANLGQPPYSLPADFASLTQTQQLLILTNEDRILYNLPPISGLTGALNQDAAATLATDSDPQPSASDDWAGYTSNAAWGTVNMVAAYEGWMYNDGPGSYNVDCTSLDPSGCWGHRHDILWQFGPGTLAMGAAVGLDSNGKTAYTMLLMQGSPSYTPVFTYTWDQAVADGAESSSHTNSTSPAGASGAGSSAPPLGAREAGATITVKLVRIRGHRVTVKVVGGGSTRLRCFLIRSRGHFTRARSCSRTVTFSRVPAGRYRLRVTSGSLTVTRRLRVR